jgi:hypothetical protein
LTPIPSTSNRSQCEKEHRGQAGIPSHLRDCRNLIAEQKPLPKVSSRPGQPPRTCAQQFLFRGLPETEWSPELNAKLLENAQIKVAMYDSYSSEMEQTAADETYLQQHRRSLGSRPIRVLTSGNHAVGHLESGLRTLPSISSMSRRPRWPRRAGLHCLRR